MKEEIKKDKKYIIIGIAIILILLLIGLAFAYLVTTLYGEKDYIVRAGLLGLKMTEGNELVLEKAIPLENDKGLELQLPVLTANLL